jgi:RNA polymerase sigma-70 factor (ECF subfamily)
VDEGVQNQTAPSGRPDDSADVALLRRIGLGDRVALRELYTKYYHPLLRFMYRITRRLDLAQESVNDVMMVVWRNSQSFGHRSSVSTWLMGIGYRKALKSLEAHRRWSDRLAAVDFDAWIEHSGPSTEQSEDADLRDLLEEGMRHLSPEQRAVVELTYSYGCSYEEIAAIMACPVNTVKTRMFHARAKLKSLLPSLAKDTP